MGTLSEQLIRLREKRKWSQKAVAERLKISHHSYSKYESSVRNPRFETLVKFRDVYGVSLDYLYGLINDDTVTVNITDLTPEQQDCILCIAKNFRSLNNFEKHTT